MKRYHVSDGGYCKEDEWGEWACYDDAEKLEQERDAFEIQLKMARGERIQMEQENAKLKSEIAALKEGPDYKGVLFALCASLSLEDTIGDVWEDVIEALDQAGICADIGSMDGFQDVLKIMPKPVMTLYGPIEEDE